MPPAPLGDARCPRGDRDAAPARRSPLLALAVLLAALAALASAGTAAAATPRLLTDACQAPSGALRIVGARTACAAGETRVQPYAAPVRVCVSTTAVTVVGAASACRAIAGSTAAVLPPARGTLALCADRAGALRKAGAAGACATGTTRVASRANRPPRARVDAARTAPGDLLAVAAPGVLRNDRDPEGRPLTARVATRPRHAARFALAADGSYTYTAHAGFTGTDTFTYRASDGRRRSAATRVTITVRRSLAPPAPRADAYDAVGNTLLAVGVTKPRPAVLATGSVLVNDVLGGNPGTAGPAAITSTGGGRVAMAADGTFTYLPKVGFTGRDTFRYTVTTRRGRRTGTVTVAVGPRVWYVDTSAARAGDGRSTSPLKDLAAVAGAAAGDLDGPGDVISLRTASLGRSIALEAGQRLLGASAPIVVGGVNVRPAGAVQVIDVPASAALTAPAIALGEGAEVSGVSLVSHVAQPVIGATGVGAATVGAAAAVAIDQQGAAPSIDVAGGSGRLAFLATTVVHRTAAPALRVAGRTGGTASFAGTLGETARRVAVELTGNTGASIALSGTLRLSRLAATGGGALTVTGDATVVATGGADPAIAIADTGIGAAGVTFGTCSASGGAGGISLAQTGTAGSFTCNGGTLAGVPGTAIDLVDTKAPRLAGVTVRDATDIGLAASRVPGLGIASSTFDGNGDAPGEPTISLADLGGSATISDSTITAASGDGIRWNPTAGVQELDVVGATTLSDIAGDNAVTVTAGGTADVTLEMTGTTLTTTGGIGVGSAAARTTVRLQGLQIRGASSFANIGLTLLGGGPHTFDVVDTAFHAAGGIGFTVLGGELATRITGNVWDPLTYGIVRVTGGSGSVVRARVAGNAVAGASALGPGIGISAGNGADVAVAVDANTIGAPFSPHDGVEILSSAGATACAIVTGNRADGAAATGQSPAGVGYSFEQADTAILRISGWDGTKTPAENLTAAGNAGNAGPLTTSTQGIVGPGACPPLPA